MLEQAIWRLEDLGQKATGFDFLKGQDARKSGFGANCSDDAFAVNPELVGAVRHERQEIGISYPEEKYSVISLSLLSSIMLAALFS
jgi:hypothetical protein